MERNPVHPLNGPLRAVRPHCYGGKTDGSLCRHHTSVKHFFQLVGGIKVHPRSAAAAQTVKPVLGERKLAFDAQLFVDMLSVTLEIYSKTWWEEREAAVSATVDLVTKAKSDGDKAKNGNPRAMMFVERGDEHLLEPQLA